MERIGYIPQTQDESDYYNYVHLRGKVSREPRWRGTLVIKFPQDLILYAQVIFKHTPAVIIESGTRFGGTSLFFADMLTLTGGKKVITIDVNYHPITPHHPLIEQIQGRSSDPETLAKVKAKISEIPNASVMVSLDSDHHKKNVAAELEAYKDIVTPGQYMVVEDSWTRGPKPYDPYYAVGEFLRANKNFRRYNLVRQFKYGVTKDGWLFRRA